MDITSGPLSFWISLAAPLRFPPLCPLAEPWHIQWLQIAVISDARSGVRLSRSMRPRNWNRQHPTADKGRGGATRNEACKGNTPEIKHVCIGSKSDGRGASSASRDLYKMKITLTGGECGNRIEVESCRLATPPRPHALTPWRPLTFPQVVAAWAAPAVGLAATSAMGNRFAAHYEHRDGNVSVCVDVYVCVCVNLYVCVCWVWNVAVVVDVNVDAPVAPAVDGNVLN